MTSSMLQQCETLSPIFLHYLACPGLSKGVAKGGMAQFQEMMRQQLESSMHTELEKLLDTTTGTEREVYSRTPSLCFSQTIWL